MVGEGSLPAPSKPVHKEWSMLSVRAVYLHLANLYMGNGVCSVVV